MDWVQKITRFTSGGRGTNARIKGEKAPGRHPREKAEMWFKAENWISV